MTGSKSSIDDLDRRIIHALQHDARHTSASEVAESLDVSARTVRNRIHKLEDAGVIAGTTWMSTTKPPATSSTR